MIVTIVSIDVKSEFLDDFIEATNENHLNSVSEPLNLRFDLLQDKNNPNHFILYEAYESEEGAVAHKQTAHYLKWRETVEPWMAKPRTGTPCNVVSPKDLKKWR